LPDCEWSSENAGIEVNIARARTTAFVERTRRDERPRPRSRRNLLVIFSSVILLRRITSRQAASKGRVIATLEGSGAELAVVVISSLQPNVGIAFRPFDCSNLTCGQNHVRVATAQVRGIHQAADRDWLK
jgi:hypothetical protein